jgi:hypothetical protein
MRQAVIASAWYVLYSVLRWLSLIEVSPYQRTPSKIEVLNY